KVWTCVQAGARSGYNFSLYETNATTIPANAAWEVRINRAVAGVETVLAHNLGGGENLIAKRPVAITVRNGTVTAWQKFEGTWQLVLQAADTTYTKGFGGISASATTNPKCHLDNFAIAE